MSYKPSDEVLEKYAKVLVNFALGGGGGIKKGEVVYLQVGLSALPMYRALVKRIFDSGGHVIGSLGDDTNSWESYFYDNASHDQLTFFPRKYLRGLVDNIDHRIAILSEHNTHELDGVDPKKMMLAQKSRKPVSDWLTKRENEGRHTWTLASYGTPAMAKEAGLTLGNYWQQIIKACFLDYADPITKWIEVSKEAERVAGQLTGLRIKELSLRGEDADLRITIGERRKWLGGGGRNIPSFEVFTSPDWRGTEGWIRFNQPLTKYGPKVEGIELHFKNGRVVKAKATKHEKFLKELIVTDTGSSQLGEFSLTDKRLSRITKFMHDDLYDENIGGPFGNTHLALGKSYLDTYDGDVAKLSRPAAQKLGYNDSATHTDMISTTDRKVTATLGNGTKKVIYQKGQFTI